MAPPLSSSSFARSGPASSRFRTGHALVAHRTALTETWLRTTFSGGSSEDLPETPVERILEITAASKARLRPDSTSTSVPTWSPTELEAEELATRRLNLTFSAALIALAACLCLVVVLP